MDVESHPAIDFSKQRDLLGCREILLAHDLGTPNLLCLDPAQTRLALSERLKAVYCPRSEVHCQKCCPVSYVVEVQDQTPVMGSRGNPGGRPKLVVIEETTVFCHVDQNRVLARMPAPIPAESRLLAVTVHDHEIRRHGSLLLVRNLFLEVQKKDLHVLHQTLLLVLEGHLDSQVVHRFVIQGHRLEIRVVVYVKDLVHTCRIAAWVETCPENGFRLVENIADPTLRCGRLGHVRECRFEQYANRDPNSIRECKITKHCCKSRVSSPAHTVAFCDVLS